MLIVRPAKLSDKAALFELARLAGDGFTSLAVGEKALERRLKKSVASFKSKTDCSPDHIYLLMLEDCQSGEVVGVSAIKVMIGLKDPFFNFRILKIAQKSTVTQKRFDMDVLMLVNEYAGATEVGSLYLKKSARGSGAGRLISQARYMLMAGALERFGDQVISELRGHVDENGISLFWEALGRKFFHMDFTDADKISAEEDNQFILDLMPKYPIYAALLPEKAQKIIGVTHPEGVGAKRYLEAEGFRFNGVIDIFDAGPSMSSPLRDIRTVRDSRIVTARAGEGDFILMALISNNRMHDFRCVMHALRFDGTDIIVPAKILERLKVKSGDDVRIWMKR